MNFNFDLITLKPQDKLPVVKVLQQALKNANTFNGNIDGIYGNITSKAVLDFKQSNSLDTANIVDISVWEKLAKYITLTFDIEFSYDVLILYIYVLKMRYSFLKLGILGESVMQKSIPILSIGTGSNQAIYVASTHANEWITTPLLIRFVEEYCIAIQNNAKIHDFLAQDLFNNTTLKIIPMLNPDGVDLVTDAMDKNSSYYKKALDIQKNYSSIPFPLGWKANISGIDLNLQFPASWEIAKSIKENEGFVSPAPRDFVGNYPLEAPEAIAIYDYIIEQNFKLLITYHTQGNVIYWKYLDYATTTAQNLGNLFSKISSYPLLDTPYNSAFAGLKDWFVFQYRLPAYTIEVGEGTSPVPITQFNDIYKRNVGILTTGLQYIRQKSPL